MTYLSDDSDESYRSVQRFFRSESAESSSAIDWLEPEAFSTPGGWQTAAVIGIIEISFSWSAPFVCFDVVCMRCDMFQTISTDTTRGMKIVFPFRRFYVRACRLCLWMCLTGLISFSFARGKITIDFITRLWLFLRLFYDHSNTDIRLLLLITSYH